MKNIFVNKNSQVRSGWKIASTWFSYCFETFLITGIMLALKGLPVQWNDVSSYVDNMTGVNNVFSLFFD